MKIRITLQFIPFVILLISAISLHAQNNVPSLSQPLTLQQCVEYALKNNIQVKQSELNVELSNINYLQSRAAVLPSLNANASHYYNFGRTIDPFTNQFATNTVQSDNFSITGSITLFSGFQNYNTILQNNYDYLASKYDLDRMRNDISLNVATAYLQILFNTELLAISQAQVGITKQQQERTKKLVEAGSVAKGNLLDIDAQYASEEVAVINAQNQLTLSYLTLSQLLELSSADKLTIVTPDLTMPSEDLIAVTPQQVFDASVKTYPAVKTAEFRLLSTQKSLAIAKGGISPRLSLNGSLGTGYSGASKEIAHIVPTKTYVGTTVKGDAVFIDDYKYDMQAIPFNTQLDRNINKSIGLNLTIPLFNRLQTYSAINRAKITEKNAELTLQLSKNQLNKSIQQAYADAVAALKKYNAGLKALVSAEEAFKYSEQRFTVNIINAVDYDIAKNKVTKAKSDLLQAKFDFIFKLKILDFFQGKALTL